MQALVPLGVIEGSPMATDIESYPMWSFVTLVVSDLRRSTEGR